MPNDDKGRAHVSDAVSLVGSPKRVAQNRKRGLGLCSEALERIGAKCADAKHHNGPLSLGDDIRQMLDRRFTRCLPGCEKGQHQHLAAIELDTSVIRAHGGRERKRGRRFVDEATAENLGIRDFLSQLDVERHDSLTAPHAHTNGIPRLVKCHCALKVPGVRRALAANFNDNISGLKPSDVGWRVANHFVHKDSPRSAVFNSQPSPRLYALPLHEALRLAHRGAKRKGGSPEEQREEKAARHGLRVATGPWRARQSKLSYMSHYVGRVSSLPSPEHTR